MSKRLNVKLRNQIVSNAVSKAGVTEAQEQNRRALDDLMEEIRLKNNGYTDEQLNAFLEDVKVAEKRIPEHIRVSTGGLYRSRMSRLNIRGQHHRVEFTVEFGREYHRVAASNAYVVVDPDSEHATRFFSLLEEDETLEAQELSIRSQVGATINNYRTVQQLLKAWPEAAELLPSDEQIINLPAVRTDVLNNLIGLPSAT